MIVKLNNIGIIKDSTIKIDGLTVVTGDNNSGKSTIGKAICSIINSTLDLREKSFREKRMFTVSVINNVIRTLNIDYLYRMGARNSRIFSEGNKLPYLFLASRGDYSFIFGAKDDEELKQILLDMIENIKKTDFTSIEEKSQRSFPRINQLNMNDRIQKSIKILQNHIEKIYDDNTLTKYAGNKILLGLNSVFNEQIQPVKEPGSTTKIVIEDDGVICYDLEIVENRMRKGEFYKNPYVYAHYISDCNVLDKIEYRSKYDDMMKRELLQYRIGIEEDDESLENVLLGNLVKRNNAFEMQQYANKYSGFLKMINKAFLDEIVFNEGKFVCKETKLDVKNLATGSKLFAIFKLLLENGSIDSETLIVLDEPENHLHPQWQLILADVIIKLIKKFGTKFIITTHSPNFLVALNAYSMKEGINPKSNYYYTKKMDNNYNVQLENVNDKMEEAYYALNKPFIDINNIFDELLEENDNE